MSLDLRAALRLAIPPFAAGKAITLGAGWLTVWVTSPAVGLPSWDQLLQGLSNWDGESYRAIADTGYPAGPLDLHLHAAGHLWAFFPGLPIAVHLVRYVILDTVLAALLVNAACGLLAMAYLARLVDLERRDARSAETAVWALALYPYAVFLTVFYTEAPFLAAASASLYYMRRGAPGDHARACAMGMLASTTRITGLALLLPLAIERLRHRRRIVDVQLPLVLLVVLPLAAFMLYAHEHSGDALAWFHVEVSESFGSRSLDWPWNGLSNTWANATSLPADRYGFVFTLEAV
ncbi:MAG TPA: mannosyltransferase family protein, partial [Candidatus Dormibacteraeota bacterium]|nr:mannosyltransferase family protein [Candidatus Dormibacteraeota bacterium]